MTTAKPKDLTLRDRLSRMTHAQACKLLGPRGTRLLAQGGRWDTDPSQVAFSARRFELSLPGAVVTIRLAAGARHAIEWVCSECTSPCEHAGAALSLILEEKLALGLAEPPRERVPVEALGAEELLQRALEDRAERARSERMTVRSDDRRRLWGDYQVANAASGKTYRVALRGAERGESYCTCPDFRKNGLGTCKHVLNVLAKQRRRFAAATFARPVQRKRTSLHLVYGERLELRLAVPDRLPPAVARIVKPLGDRPIQDLADLVKRLDRLEREDWPVTIHPDAERYVREGLLQARLGRMAARIRKDPAGHPLRTELLRAELLPYQLDGIAFAVGAGRAILADDMGLGKTIQAIGTAELLAREVGIERVLVVCPASVKAQWASEIARFSRRGSSLVLGSADQRKEQYADGEFFTICNYEQVLRDLAAIQGTAWDLIVLDEAQRIKNWEAKTSATIKGLRSPFALALSGTPLENRIDELYSVVEFVDDRRLGPAHQFFNHHRVVDERGRVLGYKNLDELRRNLTPVLLRRTRASVLGELPPRTTEVLRVPATAEQMDIHEAQMRTISSIVNKPYLTEMDLLRLRKALLLCRMAANGSSLVDKQHPGHSGKLEEIAELLARLLDEEGRKIVLFSEWTTMLDLIEDILRDLGTRWVRLDGKVPQQKRKQLVDGFQSDPGCPLFLTTNAGATGLNLQAADTVVNVDLPWNPAVLEQRIGRVHRMGQTRAVQVFLLVTECTIEERMLATLSAKTQLFEAVLDPDSEIAALEVASGMEELKRRLEVLVGRAPDGHTREEVTPAAATRDVADAGGRLLDAAFSFLAEILPGAGASEDEALRDQVRARLEGCMTRDAEGRPTLTVRLPDDGALERIAASLSRLLPAPAPRDELVPAAREVRGQGARRQTTRTP